MTLPDRVIVLRLIASALERAGFNVSTKSEMLGAERDRMIAYVDPVRHMGFRYCRIGGDERLFRDVDRIVGEAQLAFERGC
jgi:hypothetical protein